MWSVDSSGKIFLQNLICDQNKEGRPERPENIFIDLYMAL